MPTFKDKVVIVTGASSGIGEATAEHFASLNASLVLVGRNIDNLKKVHENCVKKLDSTTKHPLIVVSDVTDASAAKKVVSEALNCFGQIDVLVNNAGIGKSNTAENVNLADHDDVMNTNIRSVVAVTKEAIPHLIQTKGNIVNVSSVAGIRSFPGLMSYCMSKAAMDQFTKCAALDLASKSVRVNSVNPGVIVTDIHRRSGIEEEAYQQYLEHCKTTHALGRVGQPNEVASVIAFLASDDASFITGALLPIDGGKHAMCPR